MEDGYSSGGTAGKGLGAIKRMSSEFDVTSAPTGTVMLARGWSAGGTREQKLQPGTEGVVCTPITGERAVSRWWWTAWDTAPTPPRQPTPPCAWYGHT